MKMKGFTLIELLAIIIIAGTISIVSFASITNTIKKNQLREQEVFEKAILGATELYVSVNLEKFNNLDRVGGTVEISTDELIKNGYLKKNISNPTNMSLDQYRVVVLKNPEEYLDFVLANSAETPDLPKYKYTEENLNGADPVLESGLIPIYFDGNEAKVADLTDEWYNYNNKKWANSILVVSDRRGYYQSAKPGTSINTADILAYYVWIPRYKFKIFNTTGGGSVPTQQIEVIFENKTVEKSKGTKIGEYFTPEGFSFDGSEYNGLWVGKFETTGTENNPTVLPNATSLINMSMAEMYSSTLKFTNQNYGNDNKIRIPRFSEWSTAAKLSHTKYGINNKIRINNSSTFTTGCGAASDNQAESTTCTNKFGTVSAYPQSSTGNVTGIFDMAGGAWENTMAFKTNSSGTAYIGNSYSETSGFNGLQKDGTTVTGKVDLPKDTFYDKLKDTNTTEICNTNNYFGFIFCDEEAWYGASATYTYGDGPIVQVSGTKNSSSNSNQFSYFAYYGGATAQDGFRTVISVK